MNGLYNGKPYEQMDDLGAKPIIFGKTKNYQYFHGISWHGHVTKLGKK